MIRILCGLMLLQATPPEGGRLVWVLHRFRNDHGVVRCFLFRGGDGFPSQVGKSITRTAAAVRDRTAECVFDGVPPGEYALSAYHDENANDHLDTNFIGLPREGYAASNDARGTFGPTYDGARFKFDGTQKRLESKLDYVF